MTKILCKYISIGFKQGHTLEIYQSMYCRTSNICVQEIFVNFARGRGRGGEFGPTGPFKTA